MQMSEIIKYFGSESINLFIDNAIENIKDFKSQTSTKLDLVNDLYANNKIYKQALSKLV